MHSRPLLVALFACQLLLRSQSLVEHDPERHTATIRSGDGQLVLRLAYDTGCRLDRIAVRGRQVAAPIAARTSVRIAGRDWASTDAGPVHVETTADALTVTDIRFGPPDQQLRETWTLTAAADRIVWRIARDYGGDTTVDDLAVPEWSFASMTTWTGGRLDNGGVVWCRLLETPDATYGAHFGAVTFWNSEAGDCLRIAPVLAPGLCSAGRFTRQRDGTFTYRHAITGAPLAPAHDLRRFLADRQDLWSPVPVRSGAIAAEFELQARANDALGGRGQFAGVDGARIHELLQTIARYGVIDTGLVGGNGWRSGFVCLHEPFFAQIAAAIDDDAYTNNLAAALDRIRDHAVAADGRVKSRWCYDGGDAMPGSFDAAGYYEAQWGYLFDSQPDYVLNVAELFHLTGDREWLACHKDACERALAFLVRREIGGSGLVAMATQSHTEQRGSDWIDVIWAAHENAFVNAQLYAALQLWADAEDVLDDAGHAADYRALAARLKATFNRPTTEGGFWSEDHEWYVYWRNADGSVHGDNLVTPVNFAAIAYGLCDDPARQDAILARIEATMQQEQLFCWPLCCFPFAPDEGMARNFPFPNYENGDIFLSWGELGVRAYAARRPEVALRIVQNVLARHAQDGLSFQRCLRASQHGAGTDDILAGNCMPIVGLYRDLCGVRPQHDRLLLDPHLPTSLVGTHLVYTLRGCHCDIELGSDTSAIGIGACSVRARTPFALAPTGHGVRWSAGRDTDSGFAVDVPLDLQLALAIEQWPTAADGARTWTATATAGGGGVDYQLRGCTPGAAYRLDIDGIASSTAHADDRGRLRFERVPTGRATRRLDVQPIATATALAAQSAEFPYPVTNYREDNRGQFHFSARGGWLNDVNAPLWCDGVYHLYFQHNPHGLGWDTMHWGHATSTDLVHWVQRAPALVPEVHPGDLWSGGGVVDVDDDSGLGAGRERGAPPAILVYTGTNGVQLFYSIDGGATFLAYEGGRKIVAERGTSRDPHVVRDPQQHSWILTVWSDADGNGVDFFRSANLRDWTFASRYRAPWLFECPQLQPMTIAGTGERKWVLNTASGDYAVGDFDGTFVPDSAATPRINSAATGAGGDYYAGLNFQNVPDGRVVAMAWQGRNTGSAWTGNLTFPVERTLVRTATGLRLRSLPIVELDSLRTSTQTWSRQTLTPDAAHALLREVNLDLADITAVIDAAHSDAQHIAFRLHTASDGTADRRVVYDRDDGTLDGVPLPPRADGTVQIRMLVDRGQLELFGNDGDYYRSLGVPFDSLPGGPGIELDCDGNLALVSLTLHHLASAWTPAESTLRTNIAEPWYAATGRWTDVATGKRGDGDGDAFYLSMRSGDDFCYEGSVCVETGTAAALTCRADATATQHYTVNVDVGAGVVKLWRPGRDLATCAVPLERGRTYHLRLRAEGDHLQVWFGDRREPVIDVHDAAFRRGRFGINTFGGAGVVQDVFVRPLR